MTPVNHLSLRAEINLNEFEPINNRMLTRAWGLSARNWSKIDSLVKRYETVVINIPEDISGINPAFLEGFLGSVLNSMPYHDFKRRILFHEVGRNKISYDLAEAASRVLKDQSIMAY